MSKLILLRHGKSVWNIKNLFTGFVDIGLSKKGIDEALRAGKVLRDMDIDIVYTSNLIRAQMTAMIAMIDHSSKKSLAMMNEWSGDFKSVIPMIKDAALNERCYGKWQGLNKDEVKKEYGEKAFMDVRRGYKSSPPEGESLEMTAERAIPYFHKEILPKVQSGLNVLVSAHGNSLRAIVKEIEKISEEEVSALEIPTGELWVYENGIGTREVL